MLQRYSDYQGYTVEVTAALQLNQGQRKKCAEIDEGDSRRPLKINYALSNSLLS